MVVKLQGLLVYANDLTSGLVALGCKLASVEVL